MAQMLIGEILRTISLKKTKKEKIDFLQQERIRTPAFAAYLRHVFDPQLRFLLPPGEMEYTPMLNASDTVGRGAFFQHLKRLYIFIEGGHDLITQEQRVKLWVNLLESIDPIDAEAAQSMKDKKLPYGIPRKLIEDAYPGFLPAAKEG